MKKFLLIAVAALLLISSVSTASADSTKILKFDVMVGVPRPYTGATNAIRGLPGGGLPWVVGSADGNLKASGKLEIDVMGLVIDPNDPTAIERGVGGTNPSATFRAIVSCLSKDSAGLPTTVNVVTTAFPADAAGNSHIETVVSLPHPCIAPIIFVTNGAGTSWFAATGF